MKGVLPEDSQENDNFRIKRYVAKLLQTRNNSWHIRTCWNIRKWQDGRHHNMDATIFGIKPKMIVKGGFIAYALMGDPNASIPTTEPVYYRPMFGALENKTINIRYIHITTCIG